LEDNSDIEVDVVEIEPELLEDVREYFYVPEDKRLSTIVEDGRRFLHDSEKKYDMIFSDAFNFSVPSHLVTLEFFELVKSRLNFEGVYIMNVVGSINDTSPSFAISEMKTFKQVFNNSYFFAVKSLENPRIQNIILVGFNTEKSISFDNSSFGGNQILDINNLKIIDLNKYDLARHEIFTDNYAPVDYYHSKTIR